MPSFTVRSGNISRPSTSWRTALRLRSRERRSSKGVCSFLIIEICILIYAASCQDVLAEMVHTKDGSRAVRDFIAYGSAKVSSHFSRRLAVADFGTQDRKVIVKAIKPHVERMCKDDEAQLVLFTALDVIEFVPSVYADVGLSTHVHLSDTKLTAKSLVADIVGSAHELYKSPQGRRSLIYLVSPRTRRHFTPAQVRMSRCMRGVCAETPLIDCTVGGNRLNTCANEQKGRAYPHGRDPQSSERAAPRMDRGKGRRARPGTRWQPCRQRGDAVRRGRYVQSSSRYPHRADGVLLQTKPLRRRHCSKRSRRRIPRSTRRARTSLRSRTHRACTRRCSRAARSRTRTRSSCVRRPGTRSRSRGSLLTSSGETTLLRWRATTVLLSSRCCASARARMMRSGRC